MSKSSTSNSNRVQFKKGKQTAFFNRVHLSSKLTWHQISNVLKINPRLLSYYRNEKYTISYETLLKLISIGKVTFPKKIKILEPNYLKSLAGKKGGDATIQKHGLVGGDVNRRIKKWRIWWNSTGKHNPNIILKSKQTLRPPYSNRLAELIGILIGDGGITKYQVVITLNMVTDRQYIKYVKRLIKQIFGLIPNVYNIKKSKAINISISRKQMVDFLIDCGLKIGNKIINKIQIPEWILESSDFRKRCLRGLFDTDGSVVIENHFTSRKQYTYPRINFTNYSPVIISQINQILTDLGFHPKVRRGGKSIQLENIKEICEYFNIVGSSNPKHWQRIKPWK